MSQLLEKIAVFLELIGGSRPAPEPKRFYSLYHIAWGLWWTVLMLVVIVFSGSNSKFVYIDF